MILKIFLKLETEKIKKSLSIQTKILLLKISTGDMIEV
jgi:hypothetical protein